MGDCCRELGSVGNVLRSAAPVVAAVVLGPAAGVAMGTSAAVGSAAVGAGVGGLSAGMQGGNVLTGALFGGAGGYLAGGGLSNLLGTSASDGMLTSSQLSSIANNPAAVQAYIDAGMLSPELVQQSASAFSALPQSAQDAYIAAGYNPVGIGAASAADTSGMFSGVKSAYDAINVGNKLPNLLSTGFDLAGGYLQGQSATDAAQTAANAQIEAARIAAEASKFRPVGVTTRFGASQFGYDAAGNLTSAGYQLSPEAKAQQDALMGMSNQMLTQYQGAPAASAPMGTAAQTMFGLGQGYLQTSPQAQAQQYMSEQQALLAPSRERELAQLQAQMQAQGRGGLAVGGTSTGMMAANPQLEAYYNAKRMQDLQLAAQATQGGQQYAQFGAGMVGAGGDMLKGMYGTQTAAYAPYQTALGGATSLEALGQNPMDIGTAIGAKTSTAAAQAGMLQAQGIQGAATTMQPANAYSPWGAMLTGAGQSITGYQQQQQQQQQQNQLLSALAAGWGK